MRYVCRRIETKSIQLKLNRRDIIIRAYGLIRCVYLVFAFGTDAKNK